MHIELSIKLGKLGLDNIAYNHSNILFWVFLRVSFSGLHLCSQNTHTVGTYRIFSVAMATSCIIRQSEQWECLLFSIYCLAFELLPLVGCDTLSFVSITILVIEEGFVTKTRIKVEKYNLDCTLCQSNKVYSS